MLEELKTAEKPCLFPVAQSSSPEDLCSGNMDHGKALPTSLDLKTAGLENIEAPVF